MLNTINEMYNKNKILKSIWDFENLKKTKKMDEPG